MKVVNMHGVIIGEALKAEVAAGLLWQDAQIWEETQQLVIVDIGDYDGELVFSDRRLFARAQPHLHLKKQ